RNEVMMHARWSNILDMVMPRVRGELCDTPGQVFTHAKRVADIEIQADRWSTQPLGNFKVLFGRLQQQTRLGLDQKQDFQVVSMLGKRLQNFDEKVNRLGARLAGRKRTAGLSRDVRCAELGTKRKCPPGMVNANLAVMPLRLDERGMPVRLSMIVHGIHHEC